MNRYAVMIEGHNCLISLPPKRQFGHLSIFSSKNLKMVGFYATRATAANSESAAIAAVISQLREELKIDWKLSNSDDDNAPTFQVSDCREICGNEDPALHSKGFSFFPE